MTTTLDTIQKDFTNSLIHVTVEKKPLSRIECLIDINEELINQAKEKATLIVKKLAVLPGFRKGKAPLDRIIQHFPHEIERSTKENLLRLAAIECLNLTGIPALERNSLIENKEIDLPGKWLSFSFNKAKLSISFEIPPNVPAVDPSLFTLKAVKPEITEKQIADTVRQTLFFYADWTPISDRPVEEGDFVILDCHVVDATPSSPLFENTRFEVTDESMAAWMKPLVLGKSLNESIEGMSGPENNMTEEEKNLFSPKKVLITIKKIEKPTMPEWNEDLLKKLKVQSKEELFDHIKSLLTKETDRSFKIKCAEEVVDFLLSTYPVDLPLSIIRTEIDFRWQQLGKDPAFIKEWESFTSKDKKELVDLLTTQSNKSLQLFYLARRLIQDANLPLSKEETTSSYFSSLVMEKAIDYILSQEKGKTTLA